MDITNVAPEIFEKVSAAGVRDWLRVNTLTNKELLELVIAPVPGDKRCGITLRPADSKAIKTL